MLLEPPTRQWYCPNCSTTDQTAEAKPHTRFHTCPGLRGLTAPMLRVGTKAKVEAHEREDYVGKDNVQTDENGRAARSRFTSQSAPTSRGGPCM